MALQNLEVARVAAENARVSSENTQRQFVEVLTSGRATASPSSSSTAARPQEWSLESFLQHHPAKFNGQCTPDEADQWFHDMERIYNAKRCPEDSRLAFTEYLLTGEVSHWWSSLWMILEESRTPITWELFRQKFYREYFPDSVIFAKEVEFLELTQGNMYLSKYVDRFKHLLRFNTMAVDEDWQCHKFENGLRGDVKLMVMGLSIRDFPTLVEKARSLEKAKLEVESQQKQSQRVGGSITSRGGSNFRRTPYFRPPSLSFGGSSSSSHSSGQQSNLIMGNCLLNEKVCVVLYDSGATHSFVSQSCAEELGLSVRELQCDLTVSTPTSGLVKTSTVCVRCSVIVEGRSFKKKLVFPSDLMEMSLPLGVLRQDIIEGASCFLIMSHVEVNQDSDSLSQETSGANLPVVNEFLDVFPEEIPSLPPPREVEFSIDLRTSLIIHQTYER
ncbi:uncharacterized protein LOC106752684 [Vigna radiata var. radiata]|uniref:Uncharacterized protein LOC106752684 n=1 Tax=Vigna radiata var. radiata TaxID=3916 RepID=A0A1S3T813_VIGRR|nr:uncharacterized protein LOC106752684 [Vigna radiata var. radiata]